MEDYPECEHVYYIVNIIRVEKCIRCNDVKHVECKKYSGEKELTDAHPSTAGTGIEVDGKGRD